MADPARESNGQVFRLDFDRRLMLQFRGSGGHLRCRFAGLSRTRRRTRTDHDGRRDARRSAHGPEWPTCARQAFSAVSIWPSRGIRGRERCRAAAARSGDTLDRGEKVVSGRGESASQMGRFETKWLAVGKNLSTHRRRADGAGCQMGSLSGERRRSRHSHRPRMSLRTRIHPPRNS